MLQSNGRAIPSYSYRAARVVADSSPIHLGARPHWRAESGDCLVSRWLRERRQLRIVVELNEQIRELSKLIEPIANSDVVASRLQTIPGVDAVTALSFVATIDDVSRFDNASSVASYLALTPPERSSGARVRRLGVRKAGAARTRVALVQASWVLWRHRPADPNVQWAKAIAERRGNQKAVIAFARKLARIMFAMWRDEESYVRARMT